MHKFSLGGFCWGGLARGFCPGGFCLGVYVWGVFVLEPPVMAFPNFNHSYLPHTDASETGLGTVLYQEQDGFLPVIEYDSRIFTPAKRNYHLHLDKLEFLDLKWTICDHFRDYLYYAPTFTVFTDNNPLTYVLSSAK